MKGDVFELRAGPAAGHEQRGRRYGVVVQGDRFAHLSRWLVAPTSTSAQSTTFRPRVDLPLGSTLVLCDAVSAVDPELRLGRFVSTLTREELTDIDLALSDLLALH